MSRIVSNPSGLALSGELDLTSLMVYRAELQSHLPITRDIVVDLSALTACGSAVLALLIYLVRQAGQGGCQVKFVGADKSIQEMALLADLESLLQLSVAN